MNTMLQQSLFHNTDKPAEETYPEVLPGNGHRRLNLVGVEIHLLQPCTPQSVHNVWAATTPACMTKPAAMETTTETYPPTPNPTFSAVFVMKVEAELEVCPDRGFNIHQDAASNESRRVEAPSPQCGLLLSADVSLVTVYWKTLD